MIGFEQLVRPAILKLKPYQSARSLAVSGSTFLDANESAEPIQYDEAQSLSGRLNRYPMPQPPELIAAFSNYYDIPADQILVGRGSDEAIDLLTRSFCEPTQDKILIHSPTYGMYEVAARIQDADVVSVPLIQNEDVWELNIPEIIRQANEPQNKVKLVYICSPNNPTGTMFSEEALRALCEGIQRSLIVVDEAYAEFAGRKGRTALMRQFPRLVVLRTLSKAWALAGIRCGVVLGHSQLIAILQRVRAPYPLPQPVLELAINALSKQGQEKMWSRVQSVVRERERLRALLKQLSSVENIFSSEGNFLLVRFKSEESIMRATRKAGIILRSRTQEPGLKNCIRITTGSPEENEKLLAVLGELEG